MRFKLLLTVSAAAALAACTSPKTEEAKPAEPVAVAPAPAPAPTPPPAPEPPPAAEPTPAVAKNSVTAVEEALGAKGIKPSVSRVATDKLGGRAECAAVERKMFVMGDGKKFYAVGNYGDEAKATACMTALKAWFGNLWAKNEALFVQKGAFIFEMGADLPEADRTTAKDAFVATID